LSALYFGVGVHLKFDYEITDRVKLKKLDVIVDNHCNNHNKCNK